MNLEKSMKDEMLLTLDLVKKHIEKDDVECVRKLLSMAIRDLELKRRKIRRDK